MEVKRTYGKPRTVALEVPAGDNTFDKLLFGEEKCGNFSIFLWNSSDYLFILAMHQQKSLPSRESEHHLTVIRVWTSQKYRN